MKRCYFASTVLMLISLAGPIGQAQDTTVTLPVTQDNSIVMVDGEWGENAGEQGRMRIKGNQHVVVMAFDTSSIVDRVVNKATLVCVQGENTISGVTLSTIATAWNETRSTGLTAGIAGIDGWGYDGALFPALVGGNGNTLTHHVRSDLRDGIYYWDVPAEMIHAMTIGAAYGLAIHEDDADYGRNPTIFSREQSSQKPFMVVELGDRQITTPQAPSSLEVVTRSDGVLQIAVTTPVDTFAYDVAVDGVELGRHNIPMAVTGKRQLIAIRDLPPSTTRGDDREVKVVARSRTGGSSEPVTIRIPRAIVDNIPLVTPEISIRPASPAPLPMLGVIPVMDKYDADGKPVGSLPDDYRSHNAIFDGQRVRLIAAAGEVVGFQTLLRGDSEAAVSVNFETPSLRVDLFEAINVSASGRRIPDPLVPLPPTIKLLPNRDRVIIADIYVPFDSPPGTRRGEMVISDGRRIPIEIEVQSFSLPRYATFTCEMNGYGLPDTVSEYEALQRIAYDHRVHANILHYSHHTAAPGSRKSALDMRLKSGRRMDNKRYDDIQPGATSGFWDDFAEAMGPYIDGSLFKDGHRGPIAAPGFYLTFHESWPLHCRSYFDGNPDAYQAFAAKPEYAQTYVNILEDFVSLAKAKGWNRTGFQVYFNNKGSLGELTKAPWILDEPAGYWDYRALNYYGELTDRGRADAPSEPRARVDYRIDISRPEYCRGQLDGRDDLWIVSSSAFKQYRRLVTDRIQQHGLRAWVYGTSNHVHETNRDIQAWALDAWGDGATGLVPWQTINKDGSAMKAADQLGLFIFDKDDAGETVIHHSMRLKAFRDAEQLIEYLHLLRAKQGWSLAQMRQFIEHYVNLASDVEKTDADDAGTSRYGKLTATGIESLRLAAVALLNQ